MQRAAATQLAYTRMLAPRARLARSGVCGVRVTYSTITIPDAPVVSRRAAPHEAAASRASGSPASSSDMASATFFSSSIPTSIATHVHEQGAGAALVRMLESSERIPPEQLWSLYECALNERPQKLPDGSVRVPPKLEARHHQRVLQLLLPAQDKYVHYVRERQRIATMRRDLHASDDEALLPSCTPLDLSTPDTLAPVPPFRGMGGKNARTFARRTRQVLLEIAPAERTAAAYNDVLRVLSHGGRYRYMRDLWNDMLRARETGHVQAAPNQDTCHYMMVGLVRNFEQKLQRYKTRYERELLTSARHVRRAQPQPPSSSPVPPAHRTAAAAEHVQAAALQAAHTVSMLLLDVQKQGTLPRVLTLDLAARVLRLTGRLPEFLHLLRSGFGLDLQYPDASVPALCTPTTHTLNTTLMALGELARMPDMAVAFEVMTQPLSHAHDTQRWPVLPNTTTFKLLVRHACSAPPTLLVSNASVQSTTARAILSRLSAGPQGLPTIGIHTAEQRDAEVQARCRGAYLALARAYVDDALRMYAEQLSRMAVQLRMPRPSVLHDSIEAVHARENERRDAGMVGEQGMESMSKRWLASMEQEAALSDEAVDDKSGTHLPPSSEKDRAQDVLSSSPSEPVFVPPNVRVSYSMLRPILATTYQKRSLGQLAWLHSRADMAAVLLSAEHTLLQHAQAQVQADGMLSSLAAHATYVQRLWEGMQRLCDTWVPWHMERWSDAEYARNARRNARASKKQRTRRRAAATAAATAATATSPANQHA